MKINTLTILSLTALLTLNGLTAAQGIEYQEIVDPAMQNAMEAFRAHEIQLNYYLFYTLNERVPGFLETAGLNIRDKEGRIQVQPFYRWLAGPFSETKDPLNVALEASSRGFICIQFPSSTVAYTRDGRMAVDTSGRLVTLSGSYPIINEYTGGPIIIPPAADITISRSGVVYADGDSIGKIKVNMFSNKGMDTLATLNGSFFVSTSTEEPELVPEGEKKYSVLQGFIEESNVTKAIIGDVALAKNSSNSIAKASKALTRIMSSAVQAAQP